MAPFSLNTYTGSEPYIFIPYSRKDASRVLLLIQGLQAKHYYLAAKNKSHEKAAERCSALNT